MYAADPEVHTRMTGMLVCWAIPRAINAALRSSLNVFVEMCSCRVKARVNGAQRDPGQRIAWLRPLRAHNSAIS